MFSPLLHAAAAIFGFFLLLPETTNAGFLEPDLANDGVTPGIIEAAMKVLVVCGEKAAEKTMDKDDGPFLTCTAAQKPEGTVRFPRGLFKAILKAMKAMIAGGFVNTLSTGMFRLKKKEDATFHRELLEVAFGKLPLDVMREDIVIKDGAGGSLRAEIKELTTVPLISLGSSKIAFGDLFDKRFAIAPPPPVNPNKKKVSNSNKEGAIFEVTDTDPKRQGQNEILKAIKVTKEEVPPEFAIHKEIYNHAFADVPADSKFVPEPILPGRSSNKAYDFLVMEKLGPTFGELIEYDDANIKLEKEDIKILLTRMYLILKELHLGGYSHGDANGWNYAISWTKPHVLHIFDFGRTRNMKAMKDYTRAIEDLLAWWQNCKDMNDRYKINDDVTKQLDNLYKEFAKIGWVRDKPRMVPIFVPYTDLSMPTDKEYKAAEIVTKFNDALAPWTKEAKAGFKSKEKITKWTPAAEGKRRRRRAEALGA